MKHHYNILALCHIKISDLHNQSNTFYLFYFFQKKPPEHTQVQ